MFGMGMPEILLILGLALVVLGPKKLPELAKSLGKAFGEFKRATRDFKSAIDIDEEPPARPLVEPEKTEPRSATSEPAKDATGNDDN